MSDLISRIDAVQACQVGPSDEWSRSTKSGYNQAATDCAMNILRISAVQPDAREVALREAVNGLRKAAEDLDGYVGRGYGDEYLELADSLALPAVQPATVPLCECGMTGPCKWTECKAPILSAHVNKTPKSEHDARDVLTPAAKEAAHD